MGAAIYRSPDIFGVIPGVFGGAENANLATVAVGVRTIESSPMPLLLPSPIPGFSICDGLFDLFLGVAGPIGHLPRPI